MEDSSVQRCAGKQYVDVWKAEFFKQQLPNFTTNLRTHLLACHPNEAAEAPETSGVTDCLRLPTFQHTYPRKQEACEKVTIDKNKKTVGIGCVSSLETRKAMGGCIT